MDGLEKAVQLRTAGQLEEARVLLKACWSKNRSILLFGISVLGCMIVWD